MAYKPKNVAKFRDDSSDYPKGTSSGRGPGTVPGTTGSNDRGSQDSKAEFYNDGSAPHGSGDFNVLPTKNLDSRSKDNFGKASYSAGKPTL